MGNVNRTEQRTYGQWCPIAVGLDIVGDRWTLLICRELSLGEARFTDLKAHLPGIAPNLLTERLRALQAHGLVETAELPPPAARTVYRLTASGRSAVLPVLRAVARLGAPLLEGEAPEPFDAMRSANALLAPWYRSGDDELRVRLVVAERSSCDLVTGPHRLDIGASVGDADVTVTTTPEALAAARRPGGTLAATVTGPAAKRKAALRMFQLVPAPGRSA